MRKIDCRITRVVTNRRLPQQVDTIGVGSGQRVDVVFDADNPGTWPLHCHWLNHVTNENIYPGGILTFIPYED